MQQDSNSIPLNKPEPRKQMLSLELLPSGQKLVKINNSSLDLIQTCPRKAFYKLIRNLDPITEATALGFGSAIHKGLESYYELATTARKLPEGSSAKHLLDGYAYYKELDTPQEGILEALRQAILVACEKNITTEESDKRSAHNMIKILMGYFKQYETDGLEIYRDSEGAFIERKFEFTLFDSPELKIQFFGTIDAALINKTTGTVFIADHKTTAALGNEFFNRLKPNFQYTGYIMAAQRCFNIQTSTFMINALQVAKTKTEFARQFTDRTEEDFQELVLSTKNVVSQWLGYIENNQFPMGPVQSCASYGGCTFHDVCSVPSSIKENVIRSKFKE